MAKAMKTTWPLEEHTTAKHRLLTGYLSRWVPIFQHGRARTRHLVLIDGFAGPGVYEGGEPGSPVLMLSTFLSARTQSDTTLHCYFIEEDRARHAELDSRVSGFRGPRCEIDVLNGAYVEHYDAVMAAVAALDDPAVFAFLDPFGAVEDPDLAVSVVVRPRSEALVYLPVGHFARFLEQPKMAGTLNGVYGDTRWATLKGKRTGEIMRGLVDLYKRRLAEPPPGDRSKFYVEEFAIQPAKGERYYLFFATKHPTAVEAMREAMWQVDPANGRLFDAQAGHAGLSVWKPTLADAIRARFPPGSTFTFDDAWHYVVDHQPPFDKKRLRETLTYMRDERNWVEVPDPKTGKPSRRGFASGKLIRML